MGVRSRSSRPVQRLGPRVHIRRESAAVTAASGPWTPGCPSGRRGHPGLVADGHSIDTSSPSALNRRRHQAACTNVERHHPRAGYRPPPRLALPLVIVAVLRVAHSTRESAATLRVVRVILQDASNPRAGLGYQEIGAARGRPVAERAAAMFVGELPTRWT